MKWTQKVRPTLGGHFKQVFESIKVNKAYIKCKLLYCNTNNNR